MTNGKFLNIIVGFTFTFIIGNAVTQFYMSKTGLLSEWKGGGFGMYSEPHPNRAITYWLHWKDLKGEEKKLRVFPITSDTQKSHKYSDLRLLSKYLNRTRTYPIQDRIKPIVLEWIRSISKQHILTDPVFRVMETRLAANKNIMEIKIVNEFKVN